MFISKVGIVLDFTSRKTVKAIHSDKSSLKKLEMDCKDNDAEEDSTAPNFKDTGVYVLPEYTDGAFGKVIQTHRDLFKNTHSITFLLLDWY